MRQQAQIHIFLSPTMEALLGVHGKHSLSTKIKTMSEERIKGYIPYTLEVVPCFAVQPIAGNVIVGYVIYLVFPSVSVELTKTPIVNAAQSAIAEIVSSRAKEVSVIINIGGTFTIYSPS